MNGTEIKYNVEQVNRGFEELKQCQKELYEADILFYKGIMALGSAKGMDLIINEDSGINLYMPEKIVIECREEIKNLLNDLSSKMALIEGFNKEEQEEPETIQHREVDNSNEDNIETSIGDKKTSIEIGGSDQSKIIQAKYGAPTLIDEPISTQPIQAKYGPPVSVQPLYGVSNPIDEPISIQPIQAKYGPPVSVQPLYGVSTPIEEPITVQPLYGVSTPIEEPITVQPLYGVSTPIEEPITAQPPYDVSTPIVSVPEYEPIPNTTAAGIVEKNYISNHPKLIGGLASAFGLFGIPTIISDDLDEEEEKKANRKEDY